MDFKFRAVIDRPQATVFAFFRDVDLHAAREGSVVPVYDKVTPGPAGVGTRYREVIKLLPGLSAEMHSEISHFEPDRSLGYSFTGLGMDGTLLYEFSVTDQGTLVVQRQTLQPRGLLALLEPLIGHAFSKAAGRRLEGIKRLLESGAAQD